MSAVSVPEPVPDDQHVAEAKARSTVQEKEVILDPDEFTEVF
jgi:hypothetical protein